MAFSKAFIDQVSIHMPSSTLLSYHPLHLNLPALLFLYPFIPPAIHLLSFEIYPLSFMSFLTSVMSGSSKETEQTIELYILYIVLLYILYMYIFVCILYLYILYY